MNPSLLVNDTWKINKLLSSLTENTYLPHGLDWTLVIYFRCTFKVCSTILSNGELNTFIAPSYVPAITAGIFHCEFNHWSLVTLKVTMFIFWDCYFYSLNYRTTFLPASCPAARNDFEDRSYMPEVYLPLAWDHFLHCHSLL